MAVRIVTNRGSGSLAGSAAREAESLRAVQTVPSLRVAGGSAARRAGEQAAATAADALDDPAPAARPGGMGFQMRGQGGRATAVSTAVLAAPAALSTAATPAVAAAGASGAKIDPQAAYPVNEPGKVTFPMARWKQMFASWFHGRTG